MLAFLTTATCACVLETCESKMLEFQGPSNTLRSLQHEVAVTSVSALLQAGCWLTCTAQPASSARAESADQTT